MSVGPIELIAIKFPGNKFTGEIVPALAELIEQNTIRVIDIIFVRKDEDGVVDVIEISELDDDTYATYEAVIADVGGMLGEEDAQTFSGLLEANSSAAVMVFENVWATRFVEAVRNANGELIFNERIPRAVIEALEAEAAAEAEAEA
jgi:Family of unknown function (DUF6325)